MKVTVVVDWSNNEIINVVKGTASQARRRFLKESELPEEFAEDLDFVDFTVM